MSFEKRGRPPEDRLARQQEIYERVSPLILTVGARHLSMRDAAKAACMSIGGLYHYFPTKRELVLHGVSDAARARLCRDYRARIMNLAALGVQGYLDAYLDHSVRMLAFVRPAVHAALDLGASEFRTALDEGMRANLDELKESLRLLLPESDEASLEKLARMIRRVAFGGVFDEDFDAGELRHQLQVLLEGHGMTRQYREVLAVS